MFQPLDQIPPPTVPTTIQNKVKPMAISYLPPPWGLHSIPNVYFEQTSHSNVWACLLIASQRRPKHTFNQLFPWQGLCSCYQALHQLMISLIRVSITTGSQNTESVTVLMIISTDHTIKSAIKKKKIMQSEILHIFCWPLRARVLPCDVAQFVQVCAFVV